MGKSCFPALILQICRAFSRWPISARTGTNDFSAEPRPNWPNMPRPQVNTAPVWLRHIECA